MHSLNNRGVHSENLRIFPNCAPNKMDYRQKMVVPSSEQLKHEEEEDEDLEALRLAALKSLRAKNTLQSVRQPVLQPQPAKPRPASYQSCPVYGHQRTAKRGGYYQNRLPRQNGNFYYQSRVNQNLIEIVPVEEDNVLQKDRAQNEVKTEKSDAGENRDTEGDSKFYRYTDNASGSEEEDTKELNSTSTAPLTSKSERLEKSEFEGDGSGTEKDVQSGFDDSPREENVGDKVAGEEDDEDEGEDEVEEEDEEEDDEEEEDEKPANDDDDDILLMADLEEEDSLERLMDEMEREMNVDKPPEKKEKKPTRKDTKESPKSFDTQKARNRKSRSDRQSDKNGVSSEKVSISSSSSNPTKNTNDLRNISPRPPVRVQQKRRSLSPKPRLRKKSPRRSPRRSPPRQPKKLSREMPRTRSPRKLSPPTRLSPRPRSPQNPTTSPSWSPFGTSPLRKLSPRGRSPRSRSPRGRRSRSPRAILAPRSPRSRKSRSPRPLRSPKRLNRSRSPRIGRSRSPRVSPSRQSPRGRSPFRARSPIRARSPPRTRSPPRSKSPRGSPHRLSPLRRSSPRTRSPRLSPRRGGLSPRARSPKLSPERRRASPVRLRSPVRLSPHRSPWPSPRNSPRLSPRRRPRSPKESTRKARPRSVTPEEKPSVGYKRECASPPRKNAASPEAARSKAKQTSTSVSGSKESSSDAINDPVLEARRRKFESTKLIDPVNDNKKIKLSKKETTSKKIEAPEEREPVESPKSRDIVEEDYDIEESDLCLTDDYVYGVLEDVASDASSANEAVAMCVEMVPVKTEKVRSKKKKKRDKELYQVGKLKAELPLSERIGKEKKCKKRKDRNSSPVESSPEPTNTATVVEDLTVDEEGDLRTELSRRRAERLNRAAPIQSARLLQSAFKGVVKEVAKTNAKGIQRHAPKGEEKNNKKEERRVTVLHRQVADLPDSEEEAAVVDSKVPVRFRLGLNKPTAQESREPKAARKSSKRAGRKVKHKNNMSLTDHERKKQ